MAGGLNCCVRGCGDLAICAVRIYVPAENVRTDCHKPAELDILHEVCARHFAQLRFADFARCDVVRVARRLEFAFTTTLDLPLVTSLDFDRAWLAPIPIGSFDYLSLKARSMGQVGHA